VSVAVAIGLLDVASRHAARYAELIEAYPAAFTDWDRAFAAEAKLSEGSHMLRYGVAADADIRLAAVRSNGGSMHVDTTGTGANAGWNDFIDAYAAVQRGDLPAAQLSLAELAKLRAARIADEGPMFSMANLRTALLGDSAILFKMNPGRMQWSGLRQLFI